MTNIHNLTTFVYYATVIFYILTIFLSVFLYKEYSRGYKDEKTNKFASKLEAVLYYVLGFSYGTCILLLGALLYLMHTTLFTQGVIS